MIFMVIFEKEPKYVILFYIYGIKIAVKKKSTIFIKQKRNTILSRLFFTVNL